MEANKSNPKTAERKRPFTISRQALYARVWLSPLHHVAIELGISVKRLTRICQRLNIPLPSPNHWSSKNAEFRNPVPPLPLPDASTPDRVTVSSLATPLDPDAQPRTYNLRDEARFDAELLRHHTVVAGWLAHLRTSRRAMGRPNDGLSKVDRKMIRLLDRLFRLAERGGLSVESRGFRDFSFRRGNQSVHCEVRETRARLPGTFTTKGTGKLTFVIKTIWRSETKVQTTWSEKLHGPLRRHMQAILQSVAFGLEDLAKERAVNERARAHERRPASHSVPSSGGARNTLLDLARRHHEATLIRRFIEAMGQRGVQGDHTVAGRSVGDWLTWAQQQADLADPLHQGVDYVLSAIARSADDENCLTEQPSGCSSD